MTFFDDGMQHEIKKQRMQIAATRIIVSNLQPILCT